ncbi:MAG: NHL repeat-containing protein [Blastocatellia bacterium]|nr:NHL repeat-containing protein [Blastocatellia bacterium]
MKTRFHSNTPKKGKLLTTILIALSCAVVALLPAIAPIAKVNLVAAAQDKGGSGDIARMAQLESQLREIKALGPVEENGWQGRTHQLAYNTTVNEINSLQRRANTHTEGAGGGSLPEATFTRTGSLAAGDDTFNRPQTFNGTGCLISGVGTAVFRDVYEFQITCPTSMVAASLCAADGGNADFDSFLVIYQAPGGAQMPGFAPNGCTNALVASDDVCGDDPSVTNVPVVGGFFYVVVTSFSNNVTGNYTLFVNDGCTSMPPPPPPGMCANPTAATFVADYANNRVQRYDGTTWSVLMPTGNANGQVRGPLGVAQTSDGVTIYVADTGNSRVQRSTDSGATWTVIAKAGSSGPGDVRSPGGVAVKPDNGMVMYIADTGNHRILASTNGGTSFTVLASIGTGASQVRAPEGLAVGCDGTLFVADTGNNRIVRYPGPTPAAGTGVVVSSGPGVALNNVKLPKSLSLNLMNGDLYIADTGNSRIVVYPTGSPATAALVAGPGSFAGAVNSPNGVTVSGVGGTARVVVSDSFNNRILRSTGVAAPYTFSLLAGGAGQTGDVGSGVGQFRQPGQIR